MDMWEFAKEQLPYLLQGVPVALKVWVIVMAVGALFGIVLASGRLYGNKGVYFVATLYIEIFRGTPLIVQMFIIYLGLPTIGLSLSPFWATVVAMTCNTAAYQAEYFRGSIRSVDASQMVAARAQGMSAYQGFVYVILPQALRRVIPQWSNEAIMEFKFTSVAYVISLAEITARASEVGSMTYDYFSAFMLAGAIYLVLTNFIAMTLEYVQRRVEIPGVTLTAKRRST